MWPSHAPSPPTPEKRQLDLFVYATQHEAHHTHCYKFWILDAEEADNPIYGSYVKRAKKVFRFGSSSHEWIAEGEAKGVIFSSVTALTD